jgi:hypothetical protein
MLIVKNRKAPKHLVMGDAEGGGVRRLALKGLTQSVKIKFLVPPLPGKMSPL